MKIGRNDPCPCGSGKKYKKCCLNKEMSEVILKPKVLLIFGAGASNGAYGIEDPPPLGRDLYNRLAERYQETWGSLSQDLKDEFKNFEDGMAKLEEQNPELLLEYTKYMGIFFSKFKIDTPNNNLYCQLTNRYINKMKSNEIIIATTNYECLIELALRNSDNTIKDWEGHGGIKILKIHGSCNFLPVKESRESVVGKGRISLGKTGQVVTNLEYVDPVEVEDKIKDLHFAPAMSLYARGKRVLLGRGKIENMLREFQVYTKEVKLVIVIGLHPNSSDIHIWDYLRDAPGELLLISKEKEDCEKWGRDNRPERGKVWFNDTFLSIIKDNSLYGLIDTALR